MTYSPPLLTRRAIVLAKLEADYNTEAVPSGTTDGILVEAPDFMATMAILDRNFTRGDLSPLPHTVGRKLAMMKFTTELRSNGSVTGNIADSAVIVRLFQACGYQVTGHATPWSTPVFEVGDEQDPVSWATGGANTATDVVAYYLTVVAGGASGAATIAVTSDTAGEDSPAAAVTSGTPVALGTKGLTATPAFTGSLVAGQRWVVWAIPIGVSLKPLSDLFPSLTMYAYLDGVRHRITGALGTFTIDATAGQYGKVVWDFTGQYYPAEDQPLASPRFERTLPAQIQLARLNLDGYSAVVNALTFVQGNIIQPRPDMNDTDGYNGVRITSRKSTGGIDPEAALVASHDFWGRMSAATRMPFQWRAGNVPGNTFWCLAPNVQYDKMTYKDRTGIRVHDAGLTFARSNGDDEVMMVFC